MVLLIKLENQPEAPEWSLWSHKKVQPCQGIPYDEDVTSVRPVLTNDFRLEPQHLGSLSSQRRY